MFWFFRFLFCLLPLVASAAVKTYEYHLSNGMKLIVCEDHRVPLVVSSVWYKVGGSYEHDGITGISHMLEHMMFKGTQRFGPGVFIRKVNAYGGRQNALTSADFTMYFQVLSAEQLPLSFELEADRMRGLLFKKTLFKQERQVVMEERRMRVDDNPEALTGERFYGLAFLNSPYRHPVIGWMTDIQHLSLLDLHRWYDTWYRPNNAVLVVVGDVESSSVFNLTQKYFGSLKPDFVPLSKPKVEVPSLGPKKVILHVPAKASWLMMGYYVPTLKTASAQWKAYALYVLSNILDSGDSGYLSRNIVRGQQIAVTANSDYNLYGLYSSLLVLKGSPALGHSVDDLEAAFEQQIRHLQLQKVTQKQLQFVKTQIIANDIYKRDSMMQEVFDIGLLEMVGLSWKESKDFLSHIESVTPDQVQAVAREFLNPNNVVVAVLKPTQLN